VAVGVVALVEVDRAVGSSVVVEFAVGVRAVSTGPAVSVPAAVVVVSLIEVGVPASPSASVSEGGGPSVSTAASRLAQSQT
jgi:hypothetical protein